MPQPTNPTRWQVTGVAAAVLVLAVGYAVAQDDPRNTPPGQVQPVELPDEERSELADIAEDEGGRGDGSADTGSGDSSDDGDVSDGTEGDSDTEGEDGTEGDGGDETDAGTDGGETGQEDITDGAGDADGTDGGAGDGD